MASETASLDSAEVQPLFSNDLHQVRTRPEDGLADLTSVTSTSLPGLVVDSVIDSVSRKGDEEDQEEGYEATEDEEILISPTQVQIIVLTTWALSFLCSLDSTILSTLITDISSDLDAIPYISWITTAYLLSLSLVQPLGRLSDIFGRKPMLQLYTAIFTVGCFQCASAGSTVSFVLGRFLSGSAGGLTTLGTIILSDLVPLRKRGVYQGMGNMFYGLGSAVGGTFGGWIGHRFGWRWAFWCQVPFGVLCLVLIHLNMNLPLQLLERNPYHHKSLRDKFSVVDVAGILSLAAMLSTFILIFSVNFASYWSAGLVAAFLALSATCFVHFELTVDEPIVPIRLLADRSVLGASLANCFGTMYTFVILYYFPVYLSTVLGLNSEEIGIRMVPMIVAGSLSSILSGYYMKWTGKYWAYALVMNIAGSSGLFLLLFRTYPFGLKVLPSVFEQYTLAILPDVSYLAMLTVTLLALIAAVPMSHQSSVTSIQYAFRGIGSVLGTSIGSHLFTSFLTSSMAKNLQKVRPADLSDTDFASIVSRALHAATYIRTKAPKWAVSAMIEAYGIGCWSAYVFAAVISIFCMLSMAVIKEYTLDSTVRRDK